MTKIYIEYIELKDIYPYKNNPRNNKNAVKAVINSISKFGFKVPIIVDKDNVIIAGHTRYKAAKELNLTEVPIIRSNDLTDEQVRAYRLVDNKVAELSEWDVDLLDIELANIIDIDMTDFSFELKIDNLSEAVDDDFEVELSDSPKAYYGQIYQLGRHRLMCGDSTSISDVELLMNGNKADLLLTDPPYNVAYEGKTNDKLTIQNDSMDDDKFRMFLFNAFYAANHVMKEGASFYIWHADSEGYNFRGACRDIGWTVRQCLVWLKNNMVLGRQDYHWRHEPCLYGWKEGAAHKWCSDRKQTTILEFDRPQRNGEHPTMKPVELFDYQIKNNTNIDDVVLDLFGGSGTTLIACEQNKRIAYVMELDPKYVDVIISRWELLTGKQAILIEE